MIFTNALQASTPTTATVQHRPDARPIETSSFTGSDVSWVLGILLAILGVYTGIASLLKSKKKEEHEEAEQRAQIIRSEIIQSRKDGERDAQELKAKFSESKETIERDITSLKQQINHVDNNAKQRDDALRMHADKIETERRADFTRIVQLEAKFESLVASVNDVKTLVKDGRDEHKSQFDQLCASIREIRDAKPRG